MSCPRFALALFVLAGLAPSALAKTLEVGPGRRFPRPEPALAAARTGDVILVHPAKGGIYEKVALRVTRPGITILAALRGDKRVVFSGAGYDYSGVGKIPRAIVQFDPKAKGGRLEGFELRGASNKSANGAGVRINQADQVLVRRCDIHGNDMGIMSNGHGKVPRAVNQRIESCHIHSNGNKEDPGYNHNLYLGGYSVTVSGCEIERAVTGHNVKSRAHFTRVEYSYIHHSANREFDLVDSGETELPESHALLIGNVIEKDPKCSGNRAVIHFGQDGGKGHDGIISLVHNTIITAFRSAVVDLSTVKAKAAFFNNIIDGGRGKAQVLIGVRKGASLEGCLVRRNYLTVGFKLPKAKGCKVAENSQAGTGLPFANRARGDYRLASPTKGVNDAALPASKVKLAPTPGAPKRRGKRKAGKRAALVQGHYEPRWRVGERKRRGKASDLGAYEFMTKWPKPKGK